MSEKVMVDTQGFLTPCSKFSAVLSFAECEKCPSHIKIEETWPGKDGKPVTVKAIDMDEGMAKNSDGIDTGKPYLYDRVCGLPTKARAIRFFKFPDKTEE